jgi:hypothetical protein
LVARISWPYFQWASALILHRADAWFLANFRGNIIVLFSKSVISSSNHDLDFTCRIQCLPLEPGQLLIMQYAQSQHWDLDPQPWLN